MAKSGTNVHPKSEVMRLKDPISNAYGGQTSELYVERGWSRDHLSTSRTCICATVHKLTRLLGAPSSL